MAEQLKAELALEDDAPEFMREFLQEQRNRVTAADEQRYDQELGKELSVASDTANNAAALEEARRKAEVEKQQTLERVRLEKEQLKTKLDGEQQEFERTLTAQRDALLAQARAKKEEITAKLQKAIEERDAETRRLAEELDIVRSRVAQREKELQGNSISLQQQVAANELKAAQLAEQLAQAKRERDALQTNSSSAGASREAIDQALALKEKEIARINVATEDVKRELKMASAQLEQQMRAQQIEIEGLRARQAVLVAEHEHAKEQLAALDQANSKTNAAFGAPMAGQNPEGLHSALSHAQTQLDRSQTPRAPPPANMAMAPNGQPYTPGYPYPPGTYPPTDPHGRPYPYPPMDPAMQQQQRGMCTTNAQGERQCNVSACTVM